MILIYSIAMVFIGAFLIQYFLISYLMSQKITDVSMNVNKIYISLFTGISMAFLQVIIHNIYYFNFDWKYYLFFIILLSIIGFIYKKQIKVNEKNYMKNMIENHSNSLLISEEFLLKAQNKSLKNKTTELAHKIIEEQKKEIEIMKEELKIIEELKIKESKINKDSENVLPKNPNEITVDDLQKRNGFT